MVASARRSSSASMTTSRHKCSDLPMLRQDSDYMNAHRVNQKGGWGAGEGVNSGGTANRFAAERVRAKAARIEKVADSEAFQSKTNVTKSRLISTANGYTRMYSYSYIWIWI